LQIINNQNRGATVTRNLTMKTHTELLTELIDALYTAPITVETHPLKILAAEIKGQMMAQLPPMTTLDTIPQPDSDGWIENTGVMPECDISAIRLHDGEVVNVVNDKAWSWGMKSPNPEEFDITHYKPA